MKRTILSIFVLSCACMLMAQKDNLSKVGSGTVTYEEVMKLDIKLEGVSSEMANMLPKERKSKKVLRYNADMSLYENTKADESANEMMSSHGGATVQIKMMEPDNKMFYDLGSRKQLEQREFMTRQFLIEGDIANNEWKFTANEKVILDYPCREAVRTRDSIQTSVWFTPAIPATTGPADFVGLPGLVLAVDSDGGKRKITAINIDLTPVDSKLLAKPKKGKKITREEFDKVVAEKMKEMGAEGGARQGTFIMHVER